MPRIYITTPPEERFWRHVNKEGPVPPLHPEMSNCWLWVGSLDPQGYGHFSAGTRTAKGNPQLVYAHRFAYGDIPEGMEINHLCEIENCVRRDHLELATRMQNARYGNSQIALKAAQTHCIRGHAFDEVNTRIAKNGTRKCKACAKTKDAARSHKKRTSI